MFRQFLKMIIVLESVVSDFVSFCIAFICSRTALAAENLFLRKQLALFQEREKKASPTTVADRFVLSRLGWHRAAFRHFWRWKSRSIGRPPVSVEIRRLIRRMAAENPTWGEERIADELWLKLQVVKV